MKILMIGLLGLMLMVQGCATVPESEQTGLLSQPSASSVDINGNQLSQIREGMTLSEVAALVKKEIVVGYSSDDPSQPLAPVVVKNPYKVELVNAGGHQYSIFYYVSSIKKSDGMISDDELLPVVFENDVVVGQGWKNVLIIKANAADES